MKQLDIHSAMGGYSAILSNLYPKSFIMDGIHFASIEGFLQGLRVKNPEEQKKVFNMSGVPAKAIGKLHPIKNNTLYYVGKPFDRYSNYYQQLLNRAYNCCFFQSEVFYNALKGTAELEYIHSIGKNDKSQTILTNDEFLSRLNRYKIFFNGKSIEENKNCCYEKLLNCFSNLRNDLNFSHNSQTLSAYC